MSEYVGKKVMVTELNVDDEYRELFAKHKGKEGLITRHFKGQISNTVTLSQFIVKMNSGDELILEEGEFKTVEWNISFIVLRPRYIDKIITQHTTYSVRRETNDFKNYLRL